MASRRLAKVMSWIREEPGELRRNNSVRYVPPNKPLRRHDSTTTCSSQSVTKASSAVTVKASDFLPSNKHEKLLVMNKQSRMSLYIEDRNGIPMYFGGSSDIGSLSSIPSTTNEKLSNDVQSESLHSLDNSKRTNLGEKVIAPATDVEEENKVLRQQLADQKKLMAQVQRQNEELNELMRDKELEVQKLDALVHSLRRLVPDNKYENTEHIIEHIKFDEVGDQYNTSSQQLQILVDELASEQWKNIKLAEKHDALEAEHQNLVLQHIKNEDIIKEQQSEIASYQDTVYKCEIEKDRMQTRLNNYVWKAQLATKFM
ncbi:hypothetical protein INT43_003137 [Umbelopsis isabellina]|uniref:Uncharacterized protein n=1 Tax=Mortierella isabellina TaxID=91625 RepID=A0A8H7UCH6_MORIS|nr:hypothetical protein INT43_003137 [Umbelopsis isabellina]